MDVQDGPDAQDLRPVGTTIEAASASLGLADPPATEAVAAPTQAVTGGPGARPAQPTQPSLTAVQLALHAGWTMAVLYGKMPARTPAGPEKLPTTHELQPAERRELELNRLRHLLQRLAHLPGFAGSGLPTKVPANDPPEAALNDALMDLNLAILKDLAATTLEIQLAYELGRSLRDTVNPPDYLPDPQSPAPVPALARQLEHSRISELQEWLATLSTQFPQRAAAIVAASLGRWSELASVTFNSHQNTVRHSDSTALAARTSEYLLRQGDVWLMLLTGARSTSGLLSPEGYVAAGEAALSRSAAIIRRVLQHHWLMLLISAAILGGTLYLALTYLGGAAKVWTAIAAIGGSVGISAKTISSTASRLAAEAERPVFAMAEEDAMAWAITTMPPKLPLTFRGVRRLRKAGIAPSSSLGRI
jgi:hypothetical protein